MITIAGASIPLDLSIVLLSGYAANMEFDGEPVAHTVTSTRYWNRRGQSNRRSLENKFLPSKTTIKSVAKTNQQKHVAHRNILVFRIIKPIEVEIPDTNKGIKREDGRENKFRKPVTVTVVCPFSGIVGVRKYFRHGEFHST
jgi:hypothetical protein